MMNRALTLLLVFLLAGAAYAGSAKKSYLTRPDGAPDEDAEGWVKAKDGKKVDLLEVAVRNVDGGTTFDVFLEDADGVMQDIGDLIVDEGETGGKWKINTRRGDFLPFGAESVADLFGRAVEVRDSEGTPLLEGTVKGASNKKSKPVFIKEKIVAEDDAVDPDARAMIMAKGGRGAELLQILLQKVDPGTYVVFMTDGAGEWKDIGDLVVPEDKDSGKLMFNNKAGDALPCGAVSIADLGGRKIEIRTQLADGEEAEILIEATIPDAAPKGNKGKAKGKDKEPGGGKPE